MKESLESAFDIPFDVHRYTNEYVIIPYNNMDEYFEVRIKFRSQVRIIVESSPQRHAADMLADMANAADEKRTLFKSYRDTFIRQGGSVSIKINDIESTLEEWPQRWKNLCVRITKIIDQDVNFDEIAKSWAILATGMMLSLLNVVPIYDEKGYKDGRRTTITLDRYERNPLNRELCLQIYGFKCKVCGFDFEGVYGKIGHEYIHVHHIEQLSIVGQHVINPVKDLIPVCANCHCMLHTSTPPLVPEDLVKIIAEHNLNKES